MSSSGFYKTIEEWFPINVTVNSKHKQYHGTGTIDIQHQKIMDYVTLSSSSFIASSLEPATEIKNKGQQIINLSTSATSDIFNILFSWTWVLIFLLVIIIFAAIYQPCYLCWFLLLAIVVMILIVLLMYFWTSAIYHNTVAEIEVLYNDIKQLLPKIKDAALTSLTSYDSIQDTSI
jgi:hypothetical protein